MATITSHPEIPETLTRVGDAMGLFPESHRAAATHLPTIQEDLRVPTTSEPEPAASAAPVVASVLVLLGLSVGVAFGGSALLDLVASILPG